MKNTSLRVLFFILVSVIWIASIVFISKTINQENKQEVDETVINLDETPVTQWGQDFELVDIKSTINTSSQKAYFYKTQASEPKPLIVSLHTWSGYYDQKDDLAELCREKDLNYIHPDFRGANHTIQACCSELALTDIDNAISYAIENANVDTTKIMVIGESGGGYATLSTFMKSRHNISKFSAWASITDLAAWYNESEIRGNRYGQNILDCTGSADSLDIEKANLRSPLHWDTPEEKLERSELLIYAGIYDGIQGSVPITHSINFYNKILADASVSDSSRYVSASEKLNLLEHRKALGDYGAIEDRSVFLQKEWGKVKLIIFEGNHEMLTAYALDQLLE